MFFNLFLSFFFFFVLVEGKAIFDLHMLHKFAGDFERVRYGFLEHASSSYLSCPENTKKPLAISYLNVLIIIGFMENLNQDYVRYLLKLLYGMFFWIIIFMLTSLRYWSQS